MDEAIRKLIASVMEDLQTDALGLAAGRFDVDTWQQRTARLLLASHYGSFMLGQDSKNLTPQQQRDLNTRIGKQIDYLNAFASELDAGTLSEAQTAARAGLYAGALKASYSRGRYWGWTLPAHPTEGSECMVNCRCSWRVDVLDEEEQDADAYWLLSDTEHCATCNQRSHGWAPYRIRGGEGE